MARMKPKLILIRTFKLHEKLTIVVGDRARSKFCPDEVSRQQELISLFSFTATLFQSWAFNTSSVFHWLRTIWLCNTFKGNTHCTRVEVDVSLSPGNLKNEGPDVDQRPKEH